MTDLIDRIRGANREGWSIQALAELSGVSKRQILRNLHGHQYPRRSTQALMVYALDVIAGRICQHLDCRTPATHKLTLPEPIARTESACDYHAQHLLGGRMPGITVEHI